MKPGRPLQSIPRTWLEPALVCVALLPLLLVAALIAYDYTETRAEIDAALQSRVEILQGHIAKVLEVNTVLLDRMAERFDRLSSASIRAGQQKHHAWLASLHAKHGDVLGLAVIGADGRGSAHSQFYPVPGANASDRDYFKVHRESREAGLFISEPLTSRVANEPGFTMSQRRGSGAFDGIYNASIRAGHLLRFWQQALRHSTGELALLTRTDGVILVRYPALPANQPSRLPPHSPLLALMSSGAREGVIKTVSTLDGRPRLAAVRKLEGYPIYITYAVDGDLAFAAWRRQSATYGAAALTTTALLVALALLVRRRTRSLAAANARLLATQDELREADRRKDEFLAALAHELRNPLAAISSSTFLLERSDAASERSLAVPIIARQVRQLQRMADDLLDTARGTHGKMSIERRPVELRAVLESAADVHRERHGGRAGFTLSGAPAWVNGDVVRLQQVFDNLLENAVKYGARRVEVSVSGAGAGWVEAEVRDDGDGISPDLLPRLFEPFSQGPQTIERPRGGLGLGLALARRLVELHGGTIEATSGGAGRGTVFRVRLPAIPAPEAQAAPASAPRRADAQRRVLVVEDQDDARDSLRALLEIEGHEVLTAASGAEALAHAKAQRPEVAFIDIGLPGMDGYELARRLRLDGAGSSTLVALTGYGQESDKQRARAAGFDLHLTKPVSYEALMDVLARPSGTPR
jgi:signal transduction histidine kinase/CheY-like chemotaxis protein